jgi:ubiquinone/menaquinone biosynthesis C-methylase UbiE
VLDAACGNGFYARRMSELGAASVTAFDVEPELVAVARQRCGDRARVFCADLERPLTGLESASFDLVICALALHYLQSWAVPLGEFRRVLDRRGRLFLSISHPMTDFELSPTGNYFERELIKEEWPSFGVEVSSYRRSLSEIYGSIRHAGFDVESLWEPRPLASMRKDHPQIFERLERAPAFLCLAARRP